ncbi:ricin-type beta-trefoil lectin domain protein [Streptomyces sp. NBC_00045]|uniref:ricin-type beta-trefoil lectin domain protein n=1 Tax=Streptomyces sp. NBC_00045 TaxID=2975625 RepID=UPI00324A28A5
MGQAVAAGPDFSKVWKPPHTPLPHTASVGVSASRSAGKIEPHYEVPSRVKPQRAAAARPAQTGAVNLSAAQEDAPAKAGDLPVWIAPTSRKGPADTTVTVVRSGTRAAEAAGVNGTLLTLTVSQQGGSPTAGGVSTRVALDMGALQEATDGQFASRGRLVALPSCASVTPNLPECRKRTPVTTAFDKVTGRVSADVDLPSPGGSVLTPQAKQSGQAASSASAVPPAAPPQAMVLAAETGPSGGGGSYAATPLASSSGWVAGSSAGSMTYSYPFEMPPALGGTAPAVSLGYNSSSVDGRTSATNSQASWIGDGWDFNPGYIERSFKPCDKNGIDKSGDLCWGGFNATISAGSHSGQLVRDKNQGSANATTDAATGTWRLKGDDGSKVEFISGAANGVQDGTYAKVTDSSGTVFYFGVNHLPGGDKSDPASNSVSSVPVYSPKSGDPCYDSAKGTASFCTMWQRLSLDYIVDPNGNLTSYTWSPETNWYERGGAQNAGTGTRTAYTRATSVKKIAYGQRLSEQIAAKGTLEPAARVSFNTAERCLSQTNCDEAHRTVANKTNWPDVPVDQECKQTGTCTTYSPTYFTTRRLADVTTQVRINNAWKDIDYYELKHSFPDPKDATSEKVLWLDSVLRTGKAESPAVPLKPVTFTPVMLPNRVDGTDLVPAPPIMNRGRIQQIKTETGGVLNVDYNLPGCSRRNNVMPTAEDDNTMACYPVRWSPPGSVVNADPVLDWFNHYTVKSITENDTTTDAPAKITNYTYGPAAWHRDDNELTEAKSRTWGDFRGFTTVASTVGSGTDGPRSQSRTTYRPGMDGDKRKDGTTRSVHLTDALGRDVTDVDWLSGAVLQTETFDQANGTVTARTVNAPSGEVTTATHTVGGGLPDLVARYGSTTTTVTAQERKADGSWRTRTTTAKTDPAQNNRPDTSLNQADGLPDLCTRPKYATGPDAQRTDLLSETLIVSGANACTAVPDATNTVSGARTLYDGKAYGQAGVLGEPSSTQVLDHYNTDGTASYITTSNLTSDAYGRTSTVTDPRTTDAEHPDGATTTTTYTPASAGELPQTVTVSAPAPGVSGATWDTVQTMGTRRTTALSSTDPNGKVTTQTYDAIGRLTAVWLPGRTPQLNPEANTAFAYSLSDTPGVPSYTTTRALTRDGDTPVRTSVVNLIDGFGRSRQTQSTSPNPAYTGRLISESKVDSQGRTALVTSAWYDNSAAPGGTLVTAADSTALQQARTSYDGRGRPTVTASWALGVEQSRTTTSYPDAGRTDVVPPQGGFPSSTFADLRGKTSEVWQYSTPTATGNRADATVTAYTYTPAGAAETRKDAAGNTWKYTYDLQGREIQRVDPDAGTSATQYDAASHITSTTDALNKKLLYTYDLSGRKTGTYEGSVTAANQLVGWTFDTVAKGQPTSSTRYVGGSAGQAYTTTVKGYDEAYRVTASTTTIPGTEVGQAAGTTFSYTTTAGYDQLTGQLKASQFPALGGLPLDKMSYSRNDYGQMYAYAGATTYDVQTNYDAFGRVIRSTVNPYATQVVVTADYDQATGRLRNQYLDKQTSLNGAVQQTGYTYNDAGRITSVTTVPDNTPSATDRQCFAYDSLGRLTTAWTDTAGVTVPAASEKQTQDQGWCTSTAPSAATIGGGNPYWHDYTYDVTGNRKTFTAHDLTGDTTKDTVTTQTFPAAGTTNNGGGSGGPHALTGTSSKVGTSTTVSGSNRYDAVGNTTSTYTSKTGTAGLVWNSEGKLASYTPPIPITGIGGKCLETQGGSSANGTPAQINTCNTNGGQKFTLSGSLLKVLNKCLTASGTTAGSTVLLQPCDGTPAQTWTKRADGTLYNAAATRCLAVPGDVSTNGTDLVLGDCGTTVPAGQKWTATDQTTSYLYDADGNQLIRRNPGKNTITFGTDELTYDTTTKALTGTRYYPIPGGLTMVRVGAAAMSIQLADHHGSGQLTVESDTLAVARRAMDPFGNPRGAQPAPGTWDGDKGFVGGTLDAATGLTNLGARQYQPSTGRFISADPLLVPTDPQQWNGYAYSNNDPINLSDPSGLRPDGVCGGNSSRCVSDSDRSGVETDHHETWEYKGNGGWKWSSWTTQTKKGKRDYRYGGIGYGDWYNVTPRKFKISRNTIPGIGRYFVSTYGNNVFTNPLSLFGVRAEGAYDSLMEDIGFDTSDPAYEDGETIPEAAGLIFGGAAGEGKALERGLCHSFPPGTETLMADGSHKKIEDVEVGDEVIATDPETGESYKKTVLDTIRTEDDKDFTDLTVATEDGPASIVATDTHPFWVPELKEWVNAGDLKVGDWLRTSAGSHVQITALKRYTKRQRTHDLTIADLHTYYVLAGQTPVLVHNSNGWCGPGFRTASEAGISPNDAKRIQNAADKQGQPIIVVGSRAGNGNLNPTSDWDYILTGPSRSRHSVQNSLPRGTGDGEGSGRGRDFYQSYNPNSPRRDYTVLDRGKPYVVFEPRG